MVMSGGWIIGPAFISAPESASPQSSITPGKAFEMMASAWSLRVQRKHAGRQALGAHGDRNLERAMLARQPRKRPGFGKGHVGAMAGVACSLGEQQRAERARWQKHDLPVNEMRRECAGDVRLRGRGRGTQDQLRAAHGLGQVAGDARHGNVMAPVEILHQDAATGFAMCGDRLRGRAATAAPRARPW